MTPLTSISPFLYTPNLENAIEEKNNIGLDLACELDRKGLKAFKRNKEPVYSSSRPDVDKIIDDIKAKKLPRYDNCTPSQKKIIKSEFQKIKKANELQRRNEQSQKVEDLESPNQAIGPKGLIKIPQLIANDRPLERLSTDFVSNFIGDESYFERFEQPDDFIDDRAEEAELQGVLDHAMESYSRKKQMHVNLVDLKMKIKK